MNESDINPPLSRRKMLGGIGAAAVAAGLVAGGGGAVSAWTPKPKARPRGTDRPLTIIGWGDDDGAFAGLLNRYTDETGIETKYLEAPSDYPEMVAKYLSYFRSGYDEIDVYLLDDFSVGNFTTAGWLVDLQPAITPEAMEGFAPTVHDLFDLGGYTRLPIYVGATAYYYRTDILEEAGYEGPPATWEELVTMGQDLRERYPDKWPFMPMGSKDSGADALAVQVIWGGGGDPTVANDDGTKIALQAVHDWIHTDGIVPNTITAQGVNEMGPLVQSGEAISWYWYEGAETSYDAEDSAIKDKWAFAPWPAGPGGSFGHLHSWGWSVNAASPMTEQATEFAVWATQSAQIRDFMVDMLRIPPPNADLLADPAVRELIPYVDYLDSNASGLKWRPIDNRSPLEVNNTIGRMLTSVITEEKSVEDAAQWGHDEIAKIIG